MKDYLDNSPMWFRAKNKVRNLQFFEVLKYLMWLLWFHFHHEVTFQFKHICSDSHSLTLSICPSYKPCPSPNRFITLVKMEAVCSFEKI